MKDVDFERQFEMRREDYLAGLDFFTWTRHYHVLRDLCARVQGDVLEVGSGDGVVRRCAAPFVRSYRVMDINAHLEPDLLADISAPQPDLAGRFDAVVICEVLEHLPFDKLAACLANAAAMLRPGGLFFLSLPHRKGHALFVTQRQHLLPLRWPVGLTSLSEAWNRFVRRRIWIDPHHCWEIGDGHVRRADVQQRIAAAGFVTEQLRALPYCDYWILRRA